MGGLSDKRLRPSYYNDNNTNDYYYNEHFNSHEYQYCY